MNQVKTAVAGAGAARRWGEETPDDAVLERVRAGDTAPYEVLVYRYNRRLRYTVRRILSNEADVEEVMQETHSKALRFIRQFSGRSSFAAWLTRIAFHAALSRLRRPAHVREVSSISSAGRPLETVASSQRDPEQQLQDKEMREALEAAVRALPETYRTVLWLRKVEELSTTEVAALLEISESCIKARLRRAQFMLRDRLQTAPATCGWTNAIGELLAPRKACSG